MGDALPRLRDDLSYHPDHDSPGRYFVKDPLRQQFFSFNELQVAMMKSLDGKRSIEGVYDHLGTEYEVEVPLEKIERFVARLEREFLLDVSTYRVSDVKVRRAIHKRFRKRGMIFRARPRRESREGDLFCEAAEHAMTGDPCKAARKFEQVLELNPNNQRARDALRCIHEAFFEINAAGAGAFQAKMIRLLRPDKFLERFDRRFGRYIYSTPGILVIIAVILAGIAPIVDIMSRPQVWGTFSVWDIVMFEVVILPGLLIHELGHGLSCKHYGGKVDDLGLMLIYGVMPAAYCDTSDTYLFKERRHKVIVYLSGIFPHMFYQSIAWFIVAIIDPTLPGWNGMLVSLLAQLWVNATNLIPLVPLDGYYALSDWLGINNLRARSFVYLKSRLSKVALGVELPNDAEDDRQRRIFLIFAILAGVYTVLYIYGAWISFFLPILVDGLGIFGMAIAVLYFTNLFGKIILGYLYRFFRFIFAERRLVFSPARSLIFAGLIGATTVGLMTQSPVPIDGELVLEPNERAIIRVSEPGLVSEIRVDEGDWVEAGQVVAVFRDDTLERERAAAFVDLLKARQRLAQLETGATPEEIGVARAEVRVQATRRAAAAGRLRTARRLKALDVAQTEEVLAALAEAATTAGKSRVSIASAELMAAGARREDVAAAEAEVTRWENTLAALDERAERLVLRAPIAGVVVGEQLWLREGELFERGETLAEIHDTSALRARITPDTGEQLDFLAPGLRVAIRLTGAPHEGVELQVREVLPPPPDDERARPVIVSSEIESRAWRSGMTGHARVYGPERSLAYRLVAAPILRLFNYDLWRWL